MPTNFTNKTIKRKSKAATKSLSLSLSIREAAAFCECQGKEIVTAIANNSLKAEWGGDAPVIPLKALIAFEYERSRGSYRG